jgi:hypothetical protein
MKELRKKYGLSSSGDPGVNFTNILHAAFTSVDLKSSQKTDGLTTIFALLGSARIKAELRKMLVKSTPGGNSTE